MPRMTSRVFRSWRRSIPLGQPPTAWSAPHGSAAYAGPGDGMPIVARGRSVPIGLMLACYTDGLIEMPGADLDDSIAALSRHLARADDRDLDALIDTLVGATGTQRQRTDDIALLMLHYLGHEQ
ncbi:SpoIIE family protein phosphatase [Streptomyces sp. NPDC052107]|uniref:SpoIIE family protein phosphatase n=1 Tax=Streptomyces sp. NPDC052107 TaxID=3155632 RepID=UPI00341EA3E5